MAAKPSVEVLLTPHSSETARTMLAAIADAVEADGCELAKTQTYCGLSDLLILYGVGAPDRDAWRKKHVASGRHVVMWDMAYFDRKKITGHLRCSIDHDHPQAYLDRTPNDSSRWDALKIELREDADPSGHVVLVGLGRKSRSYLKLGDWERGRLADLRKRFPGRQIIYRPKPGSPAMKLDCPMDADSPIEKLLRGASLVSCRHSNCVLDAAVAGVPAECDDGAGYWLYQHRSNPSRKDRLDLLCRVAWWQWKATEAPRAWQFLKGMCASSA